MNYLGESCNKFDVIKIGTNYGTGVFNYAKKGTLLYVKDCKGDFFANSSGGLNGDIKSIIGLNISGNEFACNAGCFNGEVETIIGINVSGKSFAKLPYGKADKILRDSRKADIEYNCIIEGLNKEYNLNLKKIKVRKERSVS
jgi:hypothetical protein